VSKAKEAFVVPKVDPLQDEKDGVQAIVVAVPLPTGSRPINICGWLLKPFSRYAQPLPSILGIVLKEGIALADEPKPLQRLRDTPQAET